MMVAVEDLTVEKVNPNISIIHFQYCPNVLNCSILSHFQLFNFSNCSILFNFFRIQILNFVQTVQISILSNFVEFSTLLSPTFQTNFCQSLRFVQFLIFQFYQNYWVMNFIIFILGCTWKGQQSPPWRYCWQNSTSRRSEYSFGRSWYHQEEIGGWKVGFGKADWRSWQDPQSFGQDEIFAHHSSKMIHQHSTTQCIIFDLNQSF